MKKFYQGKENFYPKRVGGGVREEVEGGGSGRERVKVDPSFISLGNVDPLWPFLNVSAPSLFFTLKVKKVRVFGCVVLCLFNVKI